MKLRPIPFIVATSVSFFITGLSASESKPDGPAAASVPTSESSPNKTARPVLKTGMDAAAIRRLIGAPDEITPMETPEGKAETWNYRRVLDRQTRQVAATATNVPAFSGLPRDMGTEVQLGYRTERTTIYQVSSLLMVEGKLILAKQWRSNVVSYDD